MTTLQERAAQLDKYLIVNTKEGERQGIIVKADDAPEWVGDVVYSVHGSSLPDDWTYKAIKEAASAIEQDEDDPTVEADIYTRDLLDWLTNASGAIDYCDEATSEYGERDSIIATIQQGQAYAYAAIVSATIAALNDAEEEEEEEHTHTWGPVEVSRFTGNPHRRCECGAISLDLDEDED